jgi:AraC-like DNA-binding protein
MIQTLFAGLPFLVCLFWLILFAIEYRGANPAKRFLTYFLLACTMLYFAHAVYFHRHVELYSIIESPYTFCSLAVYPLYYLYILKLTSNKSLTIKNYWVLLPALIISLLAIFFYTMMSESERIHFTQHYFFNKEVPGHMITFAEKGQMIRITLTRIVFFVQLVPVSYFGYKKLKKFSDEVTNFYADTENKTLTPIRRLLVLFILFALFSATANHLGREFFLQEPWMVSIPSLTFSIMLFTVSFFGFKQHFTASDFNDEKHKANRQESKFSGMPTLELLKERLQQLMEEEEFFRKKDLHIADVALLTGSNRTYISNYINKELHLSFSDYINQYRISYAQSLMTQPDNTLSLMQISELSGFASEVSFYRNFKKVTGTTPNNWLKEKMIYRVDS